MLFIFIFLINQVYLAIIFTFLYFFTSNYQSIIVVFLRASLPAIELLKAYPTLLFSHPMFSSNYLGYFLTRLLFN